MSKRFLTAAFAATLLIGGCGGSGGGGDGAGSATIDPWNPPLGAPLGGATLSDGWEDLRELPQPVNVSGGWTDSVTVTPSGRRLYFAYSRYDFFLIYNNTGFVVTGPSRSPLMTGNDFKIFRTDLTPTSWDVSYHPVNSNDPTLPESSAGVNEAEDFMVFTRWTLNGPSSDGDLYSSTRTGNTWSVPMALPINPAINSACVDDNPFVVGSPNTTMTLYFESNRADDAGTTCRPTSIRHIYYTTYANGAFSPIQKVPGLNGASAGDDDTQPSFSLDQNTAYWTSIRNNTYGIFTAERENGSFTNIRPVATTTTNAPFAGKVVFIGEANVAEFAQGWLMYMMCGVAESESNGQPTNIRLKVCVARKRRQ